MSTTTFRALLWLPLSLFLAHAATAQDLYTVRAGVFRDVRGEDFETIQDLGYVYSLPAGASESEVYVGQFTGQARAAGIATQLNERGFRNARVLTLPGDAGQAERMIQFAYHGANQPIPWAKYETLGSLQAQSIDGNLKILTGPYATPEAAKAALATIKGKGFSDAFIRAVPSLQLIEIDQFETGIKKPFIPLVYTRGPEPGERAGAGRDSSATVTPTPKSPETATTPAPAPSGYGNVAPPPPTPAPAPAPPAPAPPAVTKATDGPEINPATKRHSTAELQEILKEKAYYTGSIDGLYGPGTTAAYRKAWADLPELRKYRALAELAPKPAGATGVAVATWPEVAVLLTIAEDIAAGTANAERARLPAGQRNALYDAKEKLSDVATTRSKEWASTVWEGLDLWASEDPLHAQIVTALRISYHQSQIRLEEHFSRRGLGDIEARDLAVAMMQNLTGAQLDRFL